ncbi:hypothetical protein RI578_22760 [Streptomyces sp. BB1-1-1]|uniref:hypothetical protein n=1 Tax=Streptomyces sp. BB1-1-1 TaxID=3074430 RepID=UPI0028777520|nr:hypothetical protein [Streptomyces sp. BB1-1-1]WND36932.1 hypothetical protein RI578_22760 [Streptomyces sp. BB1-1-1]
MITLPVSVVVGDRPMPVGDLELEHGEPVAPALAALFRAAADAFDRAALEEVSTDGTAE